MVPFKWLIFVLSTYGTTFGLFGYGLLKWADQGAKVQASERRIQNIEAELQFRLQVRQSILDQFNALNQRLSTIEGKLDIIQRRMLR